MSKRYFNTDFWSDTWVRTLTCQQRDLFLYLLTNERANLAGIYEIGMDRIAFDTRLPSKAITEALARFARDGKAAYLGGWLILRNAPKHQELSSPQVVKGIRRVIASVPAEVEAELYRISYQIETYNDRVSIPYIEGMDRVFLSKDRVSNFTLPYARGGGPVPPADAGEEDLFRDFHDAIKEKEKQEARRVQGLAQEKEEDQQN